MAKKDEQLAEALEELDDRELLIFMNLALSKIQESTRTIANVAIVFFVVWLVGIVLALIGVVATASS